MQQKAPSLVKGTILLTIAAFLVKVLSASYRIPFQNMVGDIGYYVYQQVYPLFGMVIALSTYGYPVLLSKWTQENSHLPANIQRHRLTESLYALCIVSVVLCSVIFLFSKEIAFWMGDVRISKMIRVASLSFLLLPVISFYRGIHQAQGNMTPTALSQVLEQGVRVAFILGSTALLVSKQASVYDIGYGAYVGTLLGGVVGATYLYLSNRTLRYTAVRKKLPLRPRRMGQFILQGVAIAVGAMLSVLLQLIDSVTVIPSFVTAGVDLQTAKAAKGVYDRGWPLVQFGLILSSSISLALVPAVIRLRMETRHREAEAVASKALRWSILVSLPASIGLMVTATDVNTMLFTDNAGSQTLQFFSITIFFISTAMVLIALQQTISSLYVSLVMVGLALVGKALFNIILVPLLGIDGLVVAQVLALLFLLTILWRKCSAFYLLRPFTSKQIIGLCLSLVSMVAVIKGIDAYVVGKIAVDSRAMVALLALIKVSAGVITYSLSCLWTRTVRMEEWKQIKTYT